MSKVVEKLIEAREKQGISQWKLARKLGIKVDTIQQVESGKDFRFSTLEKIAGELGYELFLKQKK